MEKKTTRRIIGVLVVVALVIITLPLLFTSGEAQQQPPVQTAEIKAPEFPDPQNLTTTAEATATTTAEATATPIAQTSLSAEAQPRVVEKIKDLDLNLVQNASNDAPENLPESATLISKSKKRHVEPTPIKLKDAELIKPSDNPEITIGAGGHMVEATNTSDLNQLKKGAWVIQMGSFKNKANAQRLTNALREKGFKAFTYETKSNGQTRVYVGPEFKQMAAADLASKIAEAMKMQGVVLSYKPLEL